MDLKKPIAANKPYLFANTSRYGYSPDDGESLDVNKKVFDSTLSEAIKYTEEVAPGSYENSFKYIGVSLGFMAVAVLLLFHDFVVWSAIVVALGIFVTKPLWDTMNKETRWASSFLALADKKFIDDDNFVKIINTSDMEHIADLEALYPYGERIAATMGISPEDFSHLVEFGNKTNIVYLGVIYGLSHPLTSTRTAQRCEKMVYATSKDRAKIAQDIIVSSGTAAMATSQMS